MRYCTFIILAAIGGATLAAPCAAQEIVGEELVLGSELRVALNPPEPLPTPSQPNTKRLLHLPLVDGPANADRLTLAEAESLALLFHPGLREAQGHLQAAQGNWVQVGLKPNPEIGYSGEEIGDDGTAGKQGGFFSQELVTAGKLRLNRAVASREVFAAQQRLETVRLQVLTTVRILYFDVLAAQRMVDLTRQLSELAAQSTEVSEQRLKALDIPRVSLLQSHVERESAALLEQQATERLQAAWRRLANLIGTNQTAPQLAGDALLQPLPMLEWEELRNRIMAENPQLTELRLAVDRARWTVARAQAGRVPNLNVQAGVEYDNAAQDTIANVELSMPLQIFDRNQGAIAQAHGELAAAQAALEEQELALEQRLAAALGDYATARQHAIKHSETILPVARETLEITNAGYREGELDYLSVLTVQQTYGQRNLAYLEALESAWKKWAVIDGLLVGPLPGQSE